MTLHTRIRPGRLRRGLAASAVLALPFTLAACSDDEGTDDPDVVDESPTPDDGGTDEQSPGLEPPADDEMGDDEMGDEMGDGTEDDGN